MACTQMFPGNYFKDLETFKTIYHLYLGVWCASDERKMELLCWPLTVLRVELACKAEGSLTVLERV